MENFFLGEDQIKQEIYNYYSKGEEAGFFVTTQLSIGTYYHPDIKFILYYPGHPEKNKILTPVELEEIFKNFLSNKGLELVKIEYRGGVRHVGYFTDEDTPIFECVHLVGKQKEKQRKFTMF